MTRQFLAVLICFTTGAAMAITPEDIEAASFEGQGLPDGQSPLSVKVQVLLDRADISPGVIDGYKGGMVESALRAFERREGLEIDGDIDAEVWRRLKGDTAAGITGTHRISAKDLEHVTGILPTDYAQLAERDRLGYERPSEALAELFHMDEDFLILLNPDARFAEGDEIAVVRPKADASGEVARILVHRETGRLEALSKDGSILGNYPVAVGSQETPSPSGKMEVNAVAPEPTYTYNPDLNFQQGDNDEVLILPPGANGPVGLVWIDLSKPTYGIHGTPDPARLFVEQSHGCVRMTNWDVQELAGMVGPGVSVEFVE
ncbi:L,D-transpeptidase family protein [Aestuariibius sp. 2305UL40-4]|uniref:L,D-transpeptidase family protein n=1 Tax=Aestuariibius violaceus TaxID=3234132 RepID=UPI00345E2C57